jgi:hypothetical protein
VNTKFIKRLRQSVGAASNFSSRHRRVTSVTFEIEGQAVPDGVRLGTNPHLRFRQCRNHCFLHRKLIVQQSCVGSLDHAVQDASLGFRGPL